MNESRIASFWSAMPNNAAVCGLCPHRCHIPDNASGLCGVRENRNGVLLAASYGKVSSIALDPIEKKPLNMFHPGKSILSVGGFGCNLKCQFCQNYEISSEFGEFFKEARRMSPSDIVAIAIETLPRGNIGVAYTYNEPLIGFEFVFDCAERIRKEGLRNVLVTNGHINKEPLHILLPLIDAMNIDLKGFSDTFYQGVGGNLETVKETIALCAGRCHVEVTTLVIPSGSNHSELGNEGDVDGIAQWLSSIDPNIPLHLTRFFPRYKMNDTEATPRETINKLCETARKHLKNVFGLH